MAVTVAVAEYEDLIFKAGDNWHIDEMEHLHVRDASKKHLATFPRGGWMSVRHTY